MVKLVRNKKGKSSNLLSIACQPRNIPVSPPAISTRLALLNIRSLVNKSLLVNDVIMTYCSCTWFNKMATLHTDVFLKIYFLFDCL